MRPKLFRSIREKKIAGVCAGLADYFDIDVSLVRVAFIGGVILHGIGLLGYIILWIAVPENPREFYNDAKNSDAATHTHNSDSYRQSKRKGALFAGVALIVAGFYFLLENLFPMFDFESYSPVLLIAAGVMILFYAFTSRPLQSTIRETTISTPAAVSTEDLTMTETQSKEGEVQ